MGNPVVEHARRVDRADRAVIATDAEGAVVYWGKGAEAVYGWSAGDAIGRNIIDVTPTEMSRRQAEEIMARLRAGAGWSGEFLVHARDGNRFPVQVTDTPVLDEEGRFLGVVGESYRIRYIDDTRPGTAPL